MTHLVEAGFVAALIAIAILCLHTLPRREMLFALLGVLLFGGLLSWPVAAFAILEATQPEPVRIVEGSAKIGAKPQEQ
ncbi:MAG: hypothetical protein CMM93_03270 [Rickettsiales bacterium]|nr:hypothetical protein [Rickettsiales bacterium]